MFRTSLYILAFFMILINCSCSSGDSTEDSTEAITTIETPPTATPNREGQQEADYPGSFNDMGVPQFEDSFVLNTRILDNKRGKYGMQTREETDADFDSVLNFFLEDLEKNNWKRDSSRDKKSTPEQESDDAPVKYFVTNFQKDKYLLMINVTTVGEKRTLVTKIVKEM